eukprot:CAMPEP_0170549520 /NCGR_PEP_ID=MMETSP0211-20121228/7664_1 /TAXON_ID=311385 /ORGANISM="Pseudokeronopsis sp., Strain OXSARD2" /LENGTH=120 /DNA_ID=CAMNT_0010855573 /DNA_START=1331 /DNA_END=1693 /DNA_ORIENTATION=-
MDNIYYNSSILKKLSPQTVALLIEKLGFLQKIKDKRFIYSEHKLAKSSYILLSGKVILHNEEKGFLGEISEGETFGEEAVIEEIKQFRKENAQADEDTYIMQLTFENWTKLKEKLLEKRC